MSYKSKHQKLQYSTPRIEVLLLVLESTIATGSALVQPVNDNNQIMEEWDEREKEFEIDW
ncbi:hypothetical protein [Sphingobacterium hungaricum]|uniref:Uncharacterized protein n=1 Tax=Sphingobacterium hungaricum TaxID=2082723 RepID=A0A928YQ60_9SPHI|nr:hypothetical protein [Sphingobacterium hungaricum]MBE8712665.1 hypothetical protein [Sphingobacterium hungaricum]